MRYLDLALRQLVAFRASRICSLWLAITSI